MVRCELEKARELRWLKCSSFPTKAPLSKELANKACASLYVLPDGALAELKQYWWDPAGPKAEQAVLPVFLVSIRPRPNNV
jgi:hypothetical protein